MSFLLLAILLISFSTSTSTTEDWVSLRVGTWNVMQQPWLTQWTTDVINNLGNTNLDVLVLQEVWTERVRNTIITNKEVSKDFSFFYSSAPFQKQVGCNFSDTLLLQYAQMFVGCLMQTGTNLTQIIQPYDGPINPLCNLAGIQVALYNGNPNNFECLSCLINSMQKSIDPFTTCATQSGDAYSYNGTNGILIMSKFKIRNVTETRFNSWIANRVNIHFTVKGIKFSAGHFAYNVLEDVNPLYAGFMFGDTQPQQSNDMLNKSSDVVIGDLNSGIGAVGIPEYQPRGYNLLVSGGYVSTLANVTATYCSNPLFRMCRDGNGGAYPGQAIDHILVKNNTKLRFSSSETFNSQPLMSDHIGVRAVVAKLTDDRD